MTERLKIRHLNAAEAADSIPALSDVLLDCVEGGASVGFMAPLTRRRADEFWSGVCDRVEVGESALLVAELDGRIVGTVQLLAAGPENQPHRADVAKMLVHRGDRRHGVGQALMNAVEDLAREREKTLLVLDTASDAAERLYRRRGWTVVGRVPGYALLPDGRPCDTVFFYKSLATLI